MVVTYLIAQTCLENYCYVEARLHGVVHILMYSYVRRVMVTYEDEYVMTSIYWIKYDYNTASINHKPGM